MRVALAIVLGLAAGVAIAWWASREAPDARAAREDRAAAAAAAQYEDARPVLYRWTDATGVVQITDTQPPPGQPFEKVDLQPRDGIEVDGGRR